MSTPVASATFPATSSSFESIKDILFGGLNTSAVGSGGPECQAHLPVAIKAAEGVFVSIYIVVLYVWIFRTLTPISDEAIAKMKGREKRVGGVTKASVLAILCLVFGAQVGYKMVSRTVLFLLNPCHFITMVQIFLLCAKPSKFSVAVLRSMTHNLYVTLAAMLFPVTNTLIYPGEYSLYWIQHVLIFCLPVYIIYVWGPESMENVSDFSWTLVGKITFGHYHHHFLYPIAELTYVNLNNMLCPAPSDPFGGIYYRAILIVIMVMCLMTIGKLYTATAKFLLGMPQTISIARKERDQNGQSKHD